MRIWQCRLTLQDYLFFSTVERGKVYETGGFVHNWALTYALAAAGAFGQPFAPGPWPPYFFPKQQAQYRVDLEALNALPVYVSAAAPDQVSWIRRQFNSMAESYPALPPPKSAGYPQWGWIRSIRPQSTFVFFVFAGHEVSLSQVRHVRLGKFMSKAVVTWEEARSVTRRRCKEFECSSLLNWHDVDGAGLEPVYFDLLPSAQPTPLIHHAKFTDCDALEARFRDPPSVLFPAGLAYHVPEVTKGGGVRK